MSMQQAAQSCLEANDWICGEYLRTRSQELTDATVEHVWITVASVLIGLAVAFPLALLARAKPAFAGPVLGLTTLLYTVPSLAMFSLLLPVFGLSAALVVTGLVLYSLTILVRNIMAGLQAVPAEAREAARGMGYGPGRLLWEVELPLALPALMAGLRIATVSTIALTTVGALVGKGGLGNLIDDGVQTTFKAQVLTASVLCVLLAAVADLLLLGVQRLLTPWTRIRTAQPGAVPPGSKPPGSAPTGTAGPGPVHPRTARQGTAKEAV
ncbi:ABC transporter permease [Streptomyces sp. NBC_00467]|uniref:ABC transporter permease n=1 Tax=Streptomyces sp. NBC_00467 TaxID=2975752 RepID=UPI002E19C232